MRTWHGGAAEKLEELAKFVRWQQQTIHQAYHHDLLESQLVDLDAITWRECPKDTCASARATLEELGLEV